jgi:hypothetical protein
MVLRKTFERTNLEKLEEGVRYKLYDKYLNSSQLKLSQNPKNVFEARIEVFFKK